MSFLGRSPYVGMSAAQEQAARRTNARADQSEIGGRVEQAGIPLSPAR
jgi:hypothetical protein